MILRLALALVPARWRAAVAHDLAEEAARRPRALRAWWCAAQAVRVGGKLRWADWRDRAPGDTAMIFGRNLGVDLTLALRTFRRQPGSSAAIVLTLALGIGATTATYAVFNVALFRPVPGVADPDRLLSIYIQPDLHTPSRPSASYAHMTAMRADADAVTGVANYGFREGRLKTVADGDPFVATGATVSRDYFQTLGVRARVGRLLAGDEYEAPGARLAVISERLWRRHFDNDPAIVGRTLWVNDVSFEIVGVAAAFQGMDLRGRDDFWLPYSSERALEPATAGEPDEVFTMIGRLRPGATLDVARVELSRAFDSAGVLHVRTKYYTAVAFPGLSDGVGLTARRLTTMYRVLMGGVAMLLLLACANAANLLLGRNITRRRDLALRGAIGATRARLFRELVVEAALLSVAAGAVGLAIGAMLAGLFRGARLLSYLPALDGIALDWRVVAATFAAAAATVFAFALVPAWLASGASAQDSLRDTARSGGRASRLRPALMAAQVAISLVLLAGTVLPARTVAHLRGVDLGFDANGVLSVDLRPALARAGSVMIQTRDDLAARVGDDHVAVVNFAPLTSYTGTSVARQWPTTAASLATHAVSPSFFAVMRMPILAGRTFTPEEASAAELGLAMPAVLGESAARQIFGSLTAAIGQQLFFATYRGKASWHIVGVTNDIAESDLRLGRQPSAFVPYTLDARTGTILIRTPLSEDDATALVRDSVRRVDRSVPVDTLTPISDLVDEQLSQELLLARLGGVVAAIAALLAFAGVYAVMAFFVSERTRELGIRRALGASGSHVAGQVFRRVLTMGVVGVVCGAGLTIVVARSLASWLFGVGPSDPMTIGLAGVVLLASAALAAAIPARRAARIDPAIALRAD